MLRWEALPRKPVPRHVSHVAVKKDVTNNSADVLARMIAKLKGE